MFSYSVLTVSQLRLVQDLHGTPDHWWRPQGGQEELG
jgi:hypothetical protein